MQVRPLPPDVKLYTKPSPSAGAIAESPLLLFAATGIIIFREDAERA